MKNQQGNFTIVLIITIAFVIWAVWPNPSSTPSQSVATNTISTCTNQAIGSTSPIIGVPSYSVIDIGKPDILINNDQVDYLLIKKNVPICKEFLQRDDSLRVGDPYFKVYKKSGERAIYFPTGINGAQGSLRPTASSGGIQLQGFVAFADYGLLFDVPVSQDGTPKYETIANVGCSDPPDTVSLVDIYQKRGRVELPTNILECK